MVINQNDIYVDWDYFWNRVKKYPRFLRFLYFVHLKKYYKLLEPLQPASINILELGAGTGTISHQLIKRYKGRATLVDNNTRAFELYKRLIKDKSNITYLKTDFFTLDLPHRYQLVLSDGLLEHFEDKRAIIELHKKFVEPGGLILIFALQKNFFSSFLELGERKMGYSNPLPLTECIDLVERNGLTVCNKVSYFFEYGVLCRMK